ncbi:transposase [Fructilactobacillus vespulae]|uniref:transposase n=1 Tax=Fructilactobacillus vespulae TaxID=1249630 RepID=UPI0039B61CBA
MTKYSQEFKEKLVRLYNDQDYSYSEIENIYNINRSLLYDWANQVDINGYHSLAHRAKRKYSQSFKLEVIKYYKNHDEGYSKVAAHFKINKSQVNKWVTDFKNNGIISLRSKKLGRPPMKKSIYKKTSKKIPKTKEEMYKQRILDLEEKLYYTQMELDISIKLRALREEKRNQQN